LLIEILDMWLVRNRELVLFETKDFDLDVVIEVLRCVKIGNSEIDVIDSDDFYHPTPSSIVV
jgi:hypothetical protein